MFRLTLLTALYASLDKYAGRHGNTIVNLFFCKLVDIHRVSLVQVKRIEQASVASSDHHCHMASQ